MKLSTFKKHLTTVTHPVFESLDGVLVPPHYHLTEIGLATKLFVDCGGTVRQENTISMQLRYAQDTDHRLSAKKLGNIINIFEQKVSSDDYPVEIEYQGDTIQKYGVTWNDGKFIFTPKHTDCLAKDKCGIPEDENCCGSGCC